MVLAECGELWDGKRRWDSDKYRFCVSFLLRLPSSDCKLMIRRYLFGLTFSSFLAASIRDPGKLADMTRSIKRLANRPGVIPRDLDPNPPMTQGETDDWHQPLDREFAVKQGSVVVRYCETCRSYRPPRASHCRLVSHSFHAFKVSTWLMTQCGNCVDGIDHHCSYLHTCVGKRTYFAFLTLLVSAVS
jgi:palmitoyltransferase ZDHHC9/14/18